VHYSAVHCGGRHSGVITFNARRGGGELRENREELLLSYIQRPETADSDIPEPPFERSFRSEAGDNVINISTRDSHSERITRNHGE